ncbi:transcriptional repressor [Thermanaerosceptrum fracticalcis]|uniref:Transcriptional repressor n=1 Tax=Thermanaerosceptrum fracticalcis TaxID=1712410 RepID=A0A7G6E2Z2_THEFR|nr:transcriptional repressor [Thermanaerosceptrum fracticalcis]QNB46446.1 transcriptional repressor [Thermanaerosceptrum fracticalcis]
MPAKIEFIYDTIKDKGFKLTPARKIIISVFCSSEDKFLNAAEIYDQVRSRNPKINFSTVYRNLEILVESRLIEKLNFADGAKFKLRGPESHLHHMICKSCHKTERLPYCPLGELEKTLRESTDFLPTEHRIEIYGYCKECRKNSGVEQDN